MYVKVMMACELQYMYVQTAPFKVTVSQDFLPFFSFQIEPIWALD